MATKAEQARQALAEADRQRKIAQWAEDVRRAMRLGRPVIVSEMHQRGPFGRKRKYLYELDDRMPEAAVDALYRALTIVHNEANAKADKAEAAIHYCDQGR